MMDQAFPHLLGADEMVAKRPFTHMDYIQKDRDVLVHLGRQVCLVLERYLELLQEGQPVYIDEPERRWHRFIIPRPKVLSNANKLCLVGFFSQKRQDKPSDYFTALDDRLIELIPNIPEILSYSTMALTNGDFCNLVLLLNEDAKSKWMEGETHNKAVSLSPGYYRSIRINNGVLPYGVLQYETLQITKVKYYDYSEDPPWKALRRLV